MPYGLLTNPNPAPVDFGAYKPSTGLLPQAKADQNANSILQAFGVQPQTSLLQTPQPTATAYTPSKPYGILTTPQQQTFTQNKIADNPQAAGALINAANDTVNNAFGAPFFALSGGNPLTGEPDVKGWNPIPRGITDQAAEAYGNSGLPAAKQTAPFVGAAVGLMEPMGPMGDAANAVKLGDSAMTAFKEFQNMGKALLIKDPQALISTNIKLPEAIGKITGTANDAISFTRMSLKHIADKGTLGESLLHSVPDVLTNPDEVRQSTNAGRYLISKSFSDASNRLRTVVLEVKSDGPHVVVTAFKADPANLEKSALLWRTASGKGVPPYAYPLEANAGGRADEFSAHRGEQMPQAPSNVAPIPRPVNGLVGDNATLTQFHPDDVKWLTKATDMIKNGEELSPKNWKVFQDTLAQYGMQVPKTQKKAADFFSTALESQFSKTLDASMARTPLAAGRSKPIQPRQANGWWDTFKNQSSPGSIKNPLAGGEEPNLNKIAAGEQTIKAKDGEAVVSPMLSPEIGFSKSSNQSVLGKVGNADVVIGDYGKNALIRKATQPDRLESFKDVSETLPYVKQAFKAGDTGFRKDNLVLLAQMPSGESRAIITRLNQQGQEEIINAFKIGKNPQAFVKNLESFGVPAGNRTQILSLEGRKSNPLTYRNNGILANPSRDVKGTTQPLLSRTENIPQDVPKSPILTPKSIAPELPKEVPQSGSVPLPETVQETKNKVNLAITGDTLQQRIQSAIVNSERAKNQILTTGKDAAKAAQGLNAADLKLLDTFGPNDTVSEFAKQAQNPTKFTIAANKILNYADLRLAVDRAAGGTTPRVENYLARQSWDLSQPGAIDRFNEFARQKGLQPYDGFSAQPRVFATRAEGIAAGFTPKNPTILGDLKDDYSAASNVISKQALKQGLNEAKPSYVSMSGQGRTETGKAFQNSNIPGLEGIGYHPKIAEQLKGYTPLANKDVFSLMKEQGLDPARPSTYGNVWKGLQEGGILNTVGSLYDNVSRPMKHFLLNFSGFHSINISSNYTGASIFNPLKGARGLAESVPSFFSEGVTQKVIDSFKNKVIPGQNMSVFDAGLRAGVNMDRGLPATGIARLNPMNALSRAMFDRELYTLKLNLVDQVFGTGKVAAESPRGIKLGKEINMIMGEMNNHTMNLNPNIQKWASRIFLAPQFTESKYGLLGKAISSNPTKSLALRAVVGKSLALGTLATLGTKLMTGQYPNLQQLLLNYTASPTTQSNITNPKGQKQDISWPQSFVSEPGKPIAGLLQGDPTNLIHYGEARLAPALSTGLKAATNQDYYGRPIVDPNVKKSATEQRIQNLGQGLLPIGAQAVLNKVEGKQTGSQAAINILGLRTTTSPQDPTMQKYSGIDNAKAAISAIAPDDPNRQQKMQDIFSSLASSSRRSLNYQEMMNGVKTTGIVQSDVGVMFLKAQQMKAAGDTAGLQAMAASMTDAQKKAYTTYKEGYNTKQLKSLLSSDPSKAVQFARGLDAAEQKRLTKYLTRKGNESLKSLYLQGKSQLGI